MSPGGTVATIRIKRRELIQTILESEAEPAGADTEPRRYVATEAENMKETPRDVY